MSRFLMPIILMMLSLSANAQTLSATANCTDEQVVLTLTDVNGTLQPPFTYSIKSSTNLYYTVPNVTANQFAINVPEGDGTYMGILESADGVVLTTTTIEVNCGIDNPANDTNSATATANCTNSTITMTLINDTGNAQAPYSYALKGPSGQFYTPQATSSLQLDITAYEGDGTYEVVIETADSKVYKTTVTVDCDIENPLEDTNTAAATVDCSNDEFNVSLINNTGNAVPPFLYSVETPSGQSYSIPQTNDLSAVVPKMEGNGEYILTIETNINLPEGDLGRRVYTTTVNVNCAAPLPVELVAFDLEKEGCDIAVNWETSSEENFSHFEVEWSSEGRDFSVVQQVSAKDEMGAYYGVKLNKGLAENNYFRLKMVDLDGSFEYSEIEYIDVACREELMSVYPNPLSATDSHVNVSFFAKSNQTAISVLNSFGQEVRRIQIEGTPEMENNAEINVKGLVPGTYTVMIREGEAVYYQKILIGAL